jgi:hypothetical protein
MADGGVYGDMLSAFPELISEHVVFQMEALPGGAGFTPRHGVKTVDGIFRRVPGGKMGIMGENRERNDAATLWVYDDMVDRIPQGSYIEELGELYILTKDNNHLREGGFVVFTASVVPGPTDLQVNDGTVIGRALHGYK